MTDKFLVVCGPTATGKTKLALSLAKKFKSELVSADSRQVYKGMDIGTGKDLPNKFKIKSLKLKVTYRDKKYLLESYNFYGVPLWMYDVVEPDEEFSVAHYHALASAVIEHVNKRNKLPIVVGGTGLYIKSLIQDLDTLDIPPDRQLRANLHSKNVSELQKILQAVDTLAYSRLNESDRNNPRRLIRKIELSKHANAYILSGNDSKTKYNSLVICLYALLKEIYKRIDKRIEDRYAQGIIDEIKQLLKKGYDWDLPSMDSLGYKEWEQYFSLSVNKSSSNSITDILKQWKYHEHAYARRQLTWFRKQRDLHWVNITDPTYREKVEQAMTAWYTEY